MDGDTRDAQKYDPENEDPFMNLNSDDVTPSRNLFRQKNAQHKSVLRSGNWLQIVKGSPKVSCEVSTTSPSHFLSRVGGNYEPKSGKMHAKVMSLPSKTFSSDYSQGTLQFTMRANGTPHFVFKSENQKDTYVGSLSSNVQDQNSYMIHLQRGSSSHLVGRINVSTLFSGRIIEREFVLFSNNGQIPHRRKTRGLSKKLVHVIKNNQDISRLSRTSFIHELCSSDQQFQEPNFNKEQVNLLGNNFPTNLETLAVVVKQEFPEKEIGGWGLKFLKKSWLVQTNDASKTETWRDLISMDVVIPSGIHGGPEDGPLSLIERWKSQGNCCDCGGWDLGCSLTLLKGRPRKDQFQLFIEGSKHKTTGLRIANVHGGLSLIQYEKELSDLQSFSIAMAFIHSQSFQPTNLRT